MLPSLIVVMGVAGSGKTTVGTLLAERLHWTFVDADTFHPRSNIDKINSGLPLDDDDRLPWLTSIAEWMDDALARDVSAVVGCSALKQAYRKILIRDRMLVRLVYLKGSEALIAQRVSARKGHFFSAALLHSQFDALEEPAADEQPITVSIESPPDKIVDDIMDALRGS